jgi:hypothetical protein
MSNVKKTALCGVLSALAAALLLTSRAGLTVYASPAAAGLVLGIVALEIGARRAFLCYAAVSFLSFFLAGPEGAVMFIAILGYYPVLKLVIERTRRGGLARKWVKLALKLVVFNAAVIAAYAFLIFVFGIRPDGTGRLGKNAPLALLFAGNAAFLLYDCAAGKLVPVYERRLAPALRRLFL